jgi:hypothetical protein
VGDDDPGRVAEERLAEDARASRLGLLGRSATAYRDGDETTLSQAFGEVP